MSEDHSLEEICPLVSKDDSETNEDETEKNCTNERKSIGNLQAVMHLFKAFTGVGLLGLPSGIYHAGIVAGPIALIIIAFATVYGMVILGKTTGVISKRIGVQLLTYGDLTKEIIGLHNESFGNIAKASLDIILCTMQLGFCSVYFVFLSGTLQTLLNSHHAVLWTSVFIPMVIGLALIRNVKILMYSTIPANIAFAVAVVIMLQHFMQDMKIPRDAPLATNTVSFLIGFGQLLYAFEGIATLPTLHSRMKHKDDLSKVMIVTLIIVAFVYILFATTGYLHFGMDTRPSVTYNLPREFIYQALNGIYMVVSLASYPVQLMVVIDVMLSYIDDRFNERNLLLAEYGLRIVLVLLTFVFAIVIPQLDNYMALVGCSSATIVTFIIPPILHTLCFWNEGLTKWQLVLNTVIFLFGVFSFVSGTFSSILAIFKRFQNPKAV